MSGVVVDAGDYVITQSTRLGIRLPRVGTSGVMLSDMSHFHCHTLAQSKGGRCGRGPAAVGTQAETNVLLCT